MQLLKPDKYEHIFKSLIGKRVAVLPGYGNWGDCLIWQGTFYLLNYFNIEYLVTHDISNYEIVLIQGGGNLGNFYPDITKSLLDLQKLNKEIIILPQSLNSPVNFKFSKLYVREHLSKNYCPNSEYGPDLALVLEYPNTEYKHKGTGLFLRQDNEGYYQEKKSLGDPIKVKNLEEYIILSGLYEIVITDRLHFAISALGQGRQVYLLPCVYHKSYGIWQDYLKDLGCKWLENL